MTAYVDDKILNKIKKCLALSTSSEPHEAASALRQAQKPSNKTPKGLRKLDYNIFLPPLLAHSLVAYFAVPNQRFVPVSSADAAGKGGILITKS
jgi:hypothetical protein